MPDDRRATTSLLIMARLGEEYGVPRERLLATAGLDEQSARRPGAEITGEQELQALRALAAAVPGETQLGLAAGLRYHLGTHGVWGWAIATSPTLRRAITFGPDHLGLTFGFCAVSVEPGRAALVFDASLLPEDVRELVLWRDMVATAAFGWELLVSSSPVERIELALPRGPYAEHVSEVLGVPVSWEAEANRIVYHEHLADLPLPQADAAMHAIAAQRCMELSARRHRRPGGRADVRELLLKDPADMPTIVRAAAALHTSARSLRRRLEEEGTSYRALVTEVRRGLAEQYLGCGMTVEATARRLGYSETAAFTHAFTKWSGSPPSQWARSGNMPEYPGS
ncbi:AraC family transcriptional regulator [Nonomuraea soli]|uniref:AraC-like DNA-binding protein n=1 Tax=Nonomuraea soli TaxID=1032476 RepID=A0A7W0HUH3_9ACTN|nr:AraC family transcriptional regulator [Nonomuraea soli]MBA2896168.1 AraC-like DNA-binding protein [Nonomuraea soli]